MSTQHDASFVVRRWGVVLALASAWTAVAAGADSPDDTAPASATCDQSPAETVAPNTGQLEKVATTQPEEPLPAPRYLNLRFNEDYSYLEGPPGSYQEDFFDPIKNIDLGGRWRLSLGGYFKGRWESITNELMGARRRTHDNYFLHRYLLHADLKYGKLFRVFAEGITAFKEDGDFPLRPIDENRFDMQQLFLDFRFLGEDIPLAVRFGRQDLDYGSARLISTLDWANTRRRFDAVKIFWSDRHWDVDFFYAKPVPVQLDENYHRQPDRYDENTDLYGFWMTYKGIPKHGIDAYFLAIDAVGQALNANGKEGDRSVYTIGGRFWGQPPPWDYEAEVAGQWGKFAGDTVAAWMASAVAGYTFQDCPWRPRLGVAFDWASGDDDPLDGMHQTFFQHFPFGHYYLGYLDLVGRQNVLAARADLSFKPHEKINVGLTYHAFWLADSEDALYNAAGNVARRRGPGTFEHEVGSELDLTIVYNLDRHTSFLLGWSHLWPSSFIENSGPSEDVDFFYIQYAFKF